MKKTLVILICAMLAVPAMRAQDSYHIAFISSGAVTADGVVKTAGDDFADKAVLGWSDDSQVMKVVEQSSRRQYVLAAKALPGRKSGLIGEYLMVNRQLSTRSAAYREARRAGGSYYLGYEQNGVRKTLVPTKGMFMDELPREIWLCWYDAATGQSRVATTDFRSFVDDLIVTEALVRRLMDRMGYDEDSFLALMHNFTDEAFKGIDYTPEDLDIFVSLKY